MKGYSDGGKNSIIKLDNYFMMNDNKQAIPKVFS